MATVNKILVIGASIAGPAVCYWLTKFGYSPTLIERNDTLSKGGYAIDVRGIAIDIIKKMGIYEKICDMRTQLEAGYYVDANGNILLKEQGEKFGFRQGEEVEIVRGDLVEILMQSIKDIPCYLTAVGNRVLLRGVNIVGLKRLGVDKNHISETVEFYRSMEISPSSAKSFCQNLEMVQEYNQNPIVQEIIKFIIDSKLSLPSFNA